MLVRDFEAGQDLDVVLVVREAERRLKRDGGEFLRIVLGDRTGGVPAMVWDDVPRMAELCVPGTRPARLRALRGSRQVRLADHGAGSACRRR